MTACPGCGRTTSTFFQDMADQIQTYLREQMPVWKERYAGVEEMKVAVMGCVVNGPGESKHSNIGISLPGTFEEPVAPVYVDGKLSMHAARRPHRRRVHRNPEQLRRPPLRRAGRRNHDRLGALQSMRVPSAGFSTQLLIIPLFFSLGVIGMVVAWHDDRDVASREQSATGVIVSHEPQNHNRYGYRFQIGGRDYARSQTPLKEEPKIGQSVTIYFDPLNPAENSLTSFADLADTWLARGIVLLVFSAFFIAVVGLLDLTVGRARRRSARSPPLD